VDWLRASIVAVAFLALVAVARARGRRSSVQFAMLCRVQVALALLLVLLGPATGFAWAEAFLGNLFVLERPRHVALVALLTLILASVLTLTLRVSYLNAHARFGLPRWDFPGPIARLLLKRPLTVAVGLASSTIATIFLRADVDRSSIALATAAAVAAFYVVMWVAVRIHEVFFDPYDNPFSLDLWPHWHLPAGLCSPARDFVRQRLMVLSARISAVLGPGYVTERGALGPGHSISLFYLGVFVLGYFWLYAYTSPEKIAANDACWDLPALLYVLVLLVVLAFLLPAFAFLFDYFRVPLVVAVVAVSSIAGWVADTDHYFDAVPVPSSDARLVEPLTAADAARAWASRYDQNAAPAMILATASGGGIVAAGWTARALAGLDESLGEQFTNSLALVSGVSGGSVGAMYFLDRLPADRQLDDAARARIVDGAEASALGAVGWGLVYPDLWRALAGPVFATVSDLAFDRGWAIEQAWRRWLVPSKEPLSLVGWREGVARGSRPASIFNATLVETGERLMLTPQDTKSEHGARGFLDLYANECPRETPGCRSDVAILTAARLSATFPYVSPMARGRWLETRDALPYHTADGGYYDNSGVLSAIQWLRSAVADVKVVEALRQRPILFLRIAVSAPTSPTPEDLRRPRAWLYGLFGPALTLNSVRTSTQFFRSDFEVELLKASLGADLKICEVEVFLPEDDPTKDGVESRSPLSWHLSRAERGAIAERWKSERREVVPQLRKLLDPEWGRQHPEVENICTTAAVRAVAR
jgi:hypothetical protein